jgi:hypothetical protein
VLRIKGGEDEIKDRVHARNKKITEAAEGVVDITQKTSLAKCYSCTLSSCKFVAERLRQSALKFSGGAVQPERFDSSVRAH